MSNATTQNEFVTSAGVLWDDPEAGKTWLVSIIGVIILAALVIFLSVVYFRGEEAEVVEKVIDRSDAALVQQVQAQKALLDQSGAYQVDVNEKKVERQRIPISKAMSALVADPSLAAPAPGSKKTAPPAAPAAK